MHINGIRTEALQPNDFGLHGPPPPRPRGAFTLIELLVVIGVIGILAALLLPALTAAKQRALRARCLSNVKQYDLAFIAYAIDNNDRLPGAPANPNPLPGTWPIMEDRLILDILMRQYGLTLDVLYCPAYPEFNNEWNTINTGLPSGIIQYSGVLGYCTSAPGNSLIRDPNYTTAPVLELDYLSQLMVTTRPSKRTLVADMVPSNRNPGADTNSTDMRDYTFINVVGDGYLGGSVPNIPAANIPRLRSSHVNNRHFPDGGNEGMLDGHATWVKFKDMLPRTSEDDDDDVPIYWW